MELTAAAFIAGTSIVSLTLQPKKTIRSIMLVTRKKRFMHRKKINKLPSYMTAAISHGLIKPISRAINTKILIKPPHIIHEVKAENIQKLPTNHEKNTEILTSKTYMSISKKLSTKTQPKYSFSTDTSNTKNS